MLNRSLLYVPGNSPGKLNSAEDLNADIIIFDLEDAVAYDQKISARILLKSFISSNLCRCCSAVRVNAIDTKFFIEDIFMMISAGIKTIVLPKVESIQCIITADKEIEKIEKKLNLVNKSISIFPIIETAKGVENAYEIVKSSKRIKMVLFGAEDYTVDMGVERSNDGNEIMFARMRIVNACKAAKKLAIDTVYTDINNIHGLKKDIEFIKGIGFDGKCIISPKHVEYVNDAFIPTKDELSRAVEIIISMDESVKKGLGAVSLNGKMLDEPIRKRAENILQFVLDIGRYDLIPPEILPYLTVEGGIDNE